MTRSQSVLLGLLVGAARISGAKATCKLCGSHPIPNDGLLHENHGVRCHDLFDEITFVEGSTEECSRIQLAAFQIGCCNEQYIPEEVCSVCPDGSPFQQSVTVPGSASRKELTCADLPTEASFLDFFTTPGACSDTFLQRSAAWCQCPGHEVKCHLCPAGEEPRDLSKTENVVYGWNCKSFQYIMALLSPGECSVSSQILEFDAAAFCCDGVEAPDLCDFCPIGQTIANPEKEVPTAYGMLKCGDLEESLRMIPTTSSCEFVKQSFNADMCCGFPGVASSAGDRGLSPRLASIMMVVAASEFYLFL